MKFLLLRVLLVIVISVVVRTAKRRIGALHVLLAAKHRRLTKYLCKLAGCAVFNAYFYVDFASFFFVFSVCRMHKTRMLQITVSRVFCYQAKEWEIEIKGAHILNDCSLSVSNFFPVPLAIFCQFTIKQWNALKCIAWHSIEWVRDNKSFAMVFTV